MGKDVAMLTGTGNQGPYLKALELGLLKGTLGLPRILSAVLLPGLTPIRSDKYKGVRVHPVHPVLLLMLNILSTSMDSVNLWLARLAGWLVGCFLGQALPLVRNIYHYCCGYRSCWLIIPPLLARYTSISDISVSLYQYCWLCHYCWIYLDYWLAIVVVWVVQTTHAHPAAPRSHLHSQHCERPHLPCLQLLLDSRESQSGPSWTWAVWISMGLVNLNGWFNGW